MNIFLVTESSNKSRNFSFSGLHPDVSGRVVSHPGVQARPAQGLGLKLAQGKN